MKRGQNTSSAVMQQCADRDDLLNYFPTPPWATRALCEWLAARWPLHLQSCWEPACGEGHMAMPLGEYFDRVTATDVHDYSNTYPGQVITVDFLIEWDFPVAITAGCEDWIITNPPFRLAGQFIDRALRHCNLGCAFFVRTSFLEGQSRFEALFSKHRPSFILQYAERVPLVKGRLDRDVSSATSYCWVVFLKEPAEQTVFDWIAPCRSRLERSEDYPVEVSDAAPAPLFDGVAG